MIKLSSVDIEISNNMLSAEDSIMNIKASSLNRFSSLNNNNLLVFFNVADVKNYEINILWNVGLLSNICLHNLTIF